MYLLHTPHTDTQAHNDYINYSPILLYQFSKQTTRNVSKWKPHLKSQTIVLKTYEIIGNNMI